MIKLLLLVALAIVAAGTMALAVFLGWVALCCALDIVDARRLRARKKAVEDATGRDL
jgi:hypothetical protein